MATVWTKIWFNCLKYFIIIFRLLYHGFLTVLFSGRKSIVPPVTDPILLKSAVTLASEIRQGKIKSEDVVKSYVKRIKEVNPYINAICDERFDAALREAREVDELVASHAKTPEQLEEEKPLLGIPFTVKILISVKGMPCNAGSLLHKGVKAYEDAEVVALMKNAGAICLATTNSPEFGLYFETYNAVYGRTSNPYDTTRSAAGSSGGEGALIGAGGSLLGIGNDLCGSIRHPSNFNGIFGHKPTAGLVSNKGVFPVPSSKTDSYLVTGPMCRYAEDLLLTMKVMCSPTATPIKFNSPVNFSKLKVYYVLDDGDPISSQVSSEVKNTIMKAVRYFRSTYGVDAKQVELKGLRLAFVTYTYMLMLSMDKELKQVITGGKLKLNYASELIKAIFGQSNLTFGAIAGLTMEKLPMFYNVKTVSEMVNRSESLRKELEAILDKDAVLILPSFSSTAHYHYEFLPLLFNLSFLCMFNILQLPVTQCSAGLSKDGLPLGFQIVGEKEQDHLTIACALEMQKTFGGWIPPNDALSRIK